MTSSSWTDIDVRTLPVETLIQVVRGFVDLYYGCNPNWRERLAGHLSSITDYRMLASKLDQLKSEAGVTDLIMDFDNTIIPGFSHGEYINEPASNFPVYPECQDLFRKAKNLGINVYIASYGRKSRIESILGGLETSGIAAYYCQPVLSHVDRNWFKGTYFQNYTELVARPCYGKLPHLIHILAPHSRGVNGHCGRVFVYIDDNNENCHLAKQAGIPTFKKDPKSIAITYMGC